MLVEDMKAAGYRISMQVVEEEAQLASNDVWEAYVKKLHDTDRPSVSDKNAILQLTYILLLQRHAVATCSGGKTKNSPSLSENAGPTQQDFEKADMLLKSVQAQEGAIHGNVSELVDDICGIYYRNIYMAL